MWLNYVWFGLFVVIVAGYLILDGFDLGVGILHLSLARTDTERRVLLNAIGPVWDGNEVWLVVTGGVLFAAFPMVYASLFSGFYIAMMFVLIFLIMRTVAIEFRSKRPGQGWRRVWDFWFFIASFGIALLLGVAIGNIIIGLPIDGQGNMAITTLALLGPFPLMVGVTTVFMLAMHGCFYLAMKTEDDLHTRVLRYIPRLMLVFTLLMVVLVVWLFVGNFQLAVNFKTLVWPIFIPVLALGVMLVAYRAFRQRHYFVAWVHSSLTILLLLGAVGFGLYPNLLISTIDPAYNLTIFNAASQPNVLTVMLVFALIGMPFVLLYTASVYYIFRGHVVIGPRSY